MRGWRRWIGRLGMWSSGSCREEDLLANKKWDVRNGDAIEVTPRC